MRVPADPAGSLGTMVLRVLVAEDNLLVREGIVKLLDACTDIEVVGACRTYDELLAATAADEPDVVLTDIRMPPTGTDEGIRAALAIGESHPGIGVVVLSQYAEPAYAIALFEHGSDRRGYLLKERVSDADQIVRAIEEVARGGSVLLTTHYLDEADALANRIVVIDGGRIIAEGTSAEIKQRGVAAAGSGAGGLEDAFLSLVRQNGNSIEEVLQ